MKKRRLFMHIACILLVTTLFANRLSAQVTFGSKDKPVEAALLDLKTKNSTNPTSVNDDANITSDQGGLVLSRVKLNNRKKLEPFVSDGEASAVLKLKHAGLMVYNIYQSPDTESNADLIFKPGIYTWDGARWSLLVREELNFFHMPSFNINTSVLGQHKVDLHAEYTKQFARANTLGETPCVPMIKNPSSNPSIFTYQKEQLDYFVTYYDKSTIKEVSVDNKGMLTYVVDPVPPFEPFSYINIVFVIK